jgi:hypothetical protein
MVAHSPRAFPWEIEPPVGARQGTGKHRRSARARRPRARRCLRKGCGRNYQPRCSHQRYCQHPECLHELHRWHAARRQAERRKDAKVKATHAQAEKVRRQRLKAAAQTVDNPELAPARGHAAQTFFFGSLVQSAGLPRTTNQLDPQSGTLLLPCLPAGRCERPRS